MRMLLLSARKGLFVEQILRKGCLQERWWGRCEITLMMTPPISQTAGSGDFLMPWRPHLYPRTALESWEGFTPAWKRFTEWPGADEKGGKQKNCTWLLHVATTMTTDQHTQVSVQRLVTPGGLMCVTFKTNPKANNKQNNLNEWSLQTSMSCFSLLDIYWPVSAL